MPKYKFRPGKKARQLERDGGAGDPSTATAYIFDIDRQASSDTGTDDGLLAAMGSNNSVHVYQAGTLALQQKLTGHCDVVTGLRFAHTNPSILYSSSLDGTVRCCDLRADNKMPVQTLEGDMGDKFMSLDVNCDDTVICAGSKKQMPDTTLVLWDSRTGGLLHLYPDSHSDDITQVKFHPRLPYRMASGSMDGLISIFDTSLSDEDIAVENVLNTGSSVSRLGWYGPDSDKLYCVTHMETLQLWDADEADQIGNFEGIKHNSGKELDQHAPVATIKSMEDKAVTTETEDKTVAKETGDEAVAKETGDEAVAKETGDEAVAKETGDEAVTTETDDIDRKSSGLGDVDYLVDCFWDSQQQKLMLAAGLHSGRLNVYKVKTKKNRLKPLYSLGDGHLSTIRCLHWQDKTQSLVTGGEDGLLCLWKPGMDLGKPGADLEKETETKDQPLASQEKETSDLSLASQPTSGKASSSVKTRLRLHMKKPY